MSKWYAVVRGRIPGIYTSWPACQNQIKDFSKAMHKSFKTKKDAAQYLLDMKNERDDQYSEQLQLEIKIAIHGTIALNSITSRNNIENYELCNFEVSKKYQPPLLPANITVGSLEFFNLARDHLDPGDNTIVVYCDGSKMPTVNHLGSGAYSRFRGNDYAMSAPYTPLLGKRYGLSQTESNLLSSPSMEYLAFAHVLWSFLWIRLPEENGVVYPLKDPWKIIFVCDYIGVKDFTSGAWKPKESHIIKIHANCALMIKFLKVRNINVEVLHCDGHSDVHGNELSDVMAKSTTESNNFPELVKRLSTVFLSGN